jgi:radical SAM protein with 4Fe4S-binding SPASM domain
MRYILKDNIVLRGWTDNPYALRDTSTGQTVPVSEDAFHALSLCNGIMDCESFLIPENYKRIIRYLEKRGAIKPCGEGGSNTPDQAYRTYPCRFVRDAQWAITGKCNILCRHCFMAAPQAKFGELSLEKCLDIIEQLHQAGIGSVSLTGGEALVRDDFWDLVKALADKKIAVSRIYTNGLLVDQKLLDGLKELGLRPGFSISFDGMGWHDWMRGIDGAEETAIKAIRLLRENGFPVAAASAFHRDSIVSIEETMLFMAELGVSSWKTNPACNTGNWRNEDRNLDLATGELFDAYLKTIEAYYRAGSPLNIMLGGFFRCNKGEKNYTIPYKMHRSEREPLCNSMKDTLSIFADARLLPCMPLCDFQDNMPNLNDTTIPEALSDSSYSRRVETPVSELIAHNAECRDCEHRAVCGGGCRATAVENGASGYLGIDPVSCFFFKGGYEEKIAAVAAQFLL